MIALIDYGMGNIRSVYNALQRVGANVTVTNDPAIIKDADSIVLPGVGAFRKCMDNLNKLGLIEPVIDSIKQRKPYLGICLGLQILFTESEEFGIQKGLDIIKGRVVKFDSSLKEEGEFIKIPHMGWNQIKIKQAAPIFKGINSGDYFYFVHSYYPEVYDKEAIATTTYHGIEFVSSIWKENVFATQFHPEKSQQKGLIILKNFIELVNQNLF
ncbi:MAG: imidazole glycerol phosphate synthase subunit HisH [Deltaproteobacteria bacterium]|nr:imidazole glycerol phosphate synthase subunit HisH [Deltaproteobacteria bacterium]